MNRKTLELTIQQNSSDYMFWIIATAFIFLLGWYTPVVAQELYALSTDTGLEFYQVEAVKKLDMNANSSQSALWTITRYGKTPLELHPGFQTTIHGRILTMAGRIDWGLQEDSLKLAQDSIPDLDLKGQHVAWGKIPGQVSISAK